MGGSSAADIFHGIVVTAVCMAAPLVSSGVLYGWGAYSADIRQHFGWSLSQLTVIHTFGIMGDSVVSICIGFVIQELGPAMATLVSTGLLTGSYIGLHSQATSENPDYNTIALLYLMNGVGGAGFYLLSMTTMVITWPEKYVGTAISIAEVAYSMAAVLIAYCYADYLGSVPAFYSTFIVLTLVLGLAMFVVQVRWRLLLVAIAGRSEKPTEAKLEDDNETARDRTLTAEEERDADAIPVHLQETGKSKGRFTAFEDGPANSKKRMMNRTCTMASYGSTGSESLSTASLTARPGSSAVRASLSRRSSFVSDGVLAHRVDDATFKNIFDMLPALEYLKCTYGDIPLHEGVRKPEFVMLMFYVISCFTAGEVITAQLASAKEVMHLSSYSIGELVVVLTVSFVIGKACGGFICDGLQKHPVYTRAFLLGGYAVVIGFTFVMIGFGFVSDTALLTLFAMQGLARGCAVILTDDVLQEAYGVRKLGLYVVLMAWMFFTAFVFWNYIYVETHEPGGALFGWNIWLLIAASMLPALVVAVLAWHDDIKRDCGARTSRGPMSTAL